MKINLPPNFDMEKPHKELIYCSCCKKYQHFSFNRPRRYMLCNGCGSKFTFTHVALEPCESKPYGPPKYLMVYNKWKEHPDFTIATLWRLFYWDKYSYPTIHKYVLCIKKDLESMEKV